MDICVVTNDARVARFIVLELKEAGYAAMHSEVVAAAKLCICDLDFICDAPSDCIGFSYDNEKSTSVQDFLPRPIDSERLRGAVAKRLSVFPAQKAAVLIEVDEKKRKARADGKEVRLSEKELALLIKLCETPVLTREDGAKIFGEGDSNVVDVYVHYLRKKLAKICDGETVKSKRGKGYSLSDAVTVKFI